jgi:hypothetical protein
MPPAITYSKENDLTFRTLVFVDFHPWTGHRSRAQTRASIQLVNLSAQSDCCSTSDEPHGPIWFDYWLFFVSIRFIYSLKLKMGECVKIRGLSQSGVEVSETRCRDRRGRALSFSLDRLERCSKRSCPLEENCDVVVKVPCKSHC